MLIDELITYLFDGEPHILAGSMEKWLASSRRFTAFVNSHHTKIRKKLRTVQSAENLRDLQLELETSYLLHRERSLSVAYEPQHPELGRSPDFAVTFTTSLTFMVEVTRLRSAGPGRSNTPVAGMLSGDRFTDMLCSKLGQLLSQRGNLLVVGVETSQLADYDPRGTMLRIQQRAEGNDSMIVHKHGFRDRADFFSHYYRLSALLVRGIPLQVGKHIIIWDNPQAKYPLPGKVRAALVRSHTL